MSSPSLSTSPAQGETTKKIRKKSLSLPKKSKKWHINAMGEVIYKDHSSFGIMKQIQMGIRTSVSIMYLKYIDKIDFKYGPNFTSKRSTNSYT